MFESKLGDVILKCNTLNTEKIQMTVMNQAKPHSKYNI